MAHDLSNLVQANAHDTLMLCSVVFQMISQTTLHGYMVQLLLSPTDEKSLECFAVLMTTTGNELDRGGAKVGVWSLLVGYPWVFSFYSAGWTSILAECMTSSERGKSPCEPSLHFRMLWTLERTSGYHLITSAERSLQV